MSAQTQSEGLDVCQCCEGVQALTPAPITNLPGLSAMAYRAGTQAAFLETMLARLSNFYLEIPTGGVDAGGQPVTTRISPLQNLTSRRLDDASIALLDAWATLLDVITFYQERIANEGFLRTATERLSVLELARSIGYELRPGVAAATYLAFTLEDAIGAPTSVTLDLGTKVQSLPEPGEQPQTFESAGKIEARTAWQNMLSRQSQPQKLSIENEQLYLLDGANGKTEATQLYLAGSQTQLKPGDLLLIAWRANSKAPLQTVLKTLRRVVLQSEFKRTRVDFDLEKAPRHPAFVPVTYPPGKLDLQAPPLPFSKAAVDRNIVRQTWNEQDLQAFLSQNGWKAEEVLQYLAAPPVPAGPTIPEGVFAFQGRTGFFGNNAPLYASLPKPVPNAAAPASSAPRILQVHGEGLGTDFIQVSHTGITPNDPKDWDAGGGRSVWVNSTQQLYSLVDGYDIYLERSLPEVISNSWAVFKNPQDLYLPYLVGGVTESSLADYGLSARVTGLKLTNPDGSALGQKEPTFKVRTATAFVQSQQLELTVGLPLEDILPSGERILMLDRMVLGLQIGQPVALSGKRADVPGVDSAEILTLENISHSGGYTSLTFKLGWTASYKRASVRLNANVVLATHGESKSEVLGSGDGGQTFQKFVLKQTPLTYIPATTPSGGLSSLQVRVNDVLWSEVASLYGLSPRQHVYITRLDDAGKVTVQFGDNRSGARLPTGRENVKASYRVGTGLAGQVKAGQLSLLMSRPLGVKGVSNPIAATGAADPEGRDQARRNAPLQVLTLDRVVSLQDFEDFTAAFSGIGKAQARWLWEGEQRIIHLTAAAANGGPVSPGATLFTNLAIALDAARDPIQPVRIQSFQPLSFNLEAAILLDPAYLKDIVWPAIISGLQQTFSFEQRSFGQGVSASEILALLQGVEGVKAANLVRLYLVGKEAKINSFLSARPASTSQGAELLTLNRQGITLTEMQI
jgi:hypothetical protein